MSTNYHEPTTKLLESSVSTLQSDVSTIKTSTSTSIPSQLTSISSSLSGARTDITSLTSAVSAVQTTVSGSSIDVSSLISSVVGSGISIIGIPNVNVGNRVSGHKCTTSSSETTLFITNTAGFAFVQAAGDPSLASSAIVRVYQGSIATENLVSHAIIPAGTSQVVLCMPAYSNTGFVVTAQADGTNSVCVSFCYYSPSPSTSYDFQTGWDTYIYAGSANTNYGNGNTWNVGRLSGTNDYHALLKFDLSSIPVGSLVSSAMLTLTVQASAGGNLTDFQIHRCLKDWVELEATWNIYSTGNNWAVAGGQSGTDYSSAIEYNGTITAIVGETVTFDVTPLVKGWVDGTWNDYGMFILDAVPASGVYKTFHSFSATLPANRPKLTVSLV